MALSEIQLGIGLITGVNIQDILPCGFDPFSRYRDKLEYECLEETNLNTNVLILLVGFSPKSETLSLEKMYL